MAMPRRMTAPVQTFLERVHARHRGTFDGEVATYIPALAAADPAAYGIALMTVDGMGYDFGDSTVPFTIQSISKPFTYGLVLDDLGEHAVRRHIGVEPTGDAFNAITLAPGSGRALNPMVNAGAIAAASLVADVDGSSALDRIVALYGAAAGRRLVIDDIVFRSERETGHRNRAIGHLLRASGVVDDDPDDALDRYFAQCSVEVDAIALATMAATLANGGINPRTGDRVLSGPTVRAVLSVMTTCGMYDSAGEWLFTVGLPAKSGVSGGILAIVPGQLGIAVYSPPLDSHGNIEPDEIGTDAALLRGLGPEDAAAVQAHLERRRFAPGSAIVRRGDPACELFQIVSGRLSVMVDRPGGGGPRRLTTLTDGTLFGELAFVSQETRTADVYADTMVECLVLSADAFERLKADAPRAAAAVLTNLLRVVGATARRLTDELALLAD